jgi:hypothetical protein
VVTRQEPTGTLASGNDGGVEGQGFFDILPMAKNTKNITTANTIRVHGCRRLFRKFMGDRPYSVRASTCGTQSVNVHSKHPPDQKETDDCDQNMAGPLARRLRIAKVKHAAIVAF